jgi:CBS domain-containing protein
LEPVAEFLSEYPPFDELSDADLEGVAAEAEIEYFPAGHVVLEQGADAVENVWVVRSGAVDLLDRGRILDRLEPGELFGHPSMLSGLETNYEVKAAEDSLSYRLPASSVVPLLGRPGGLRYVARSLLSRRSLVPPEAAAGDPAQQPAARLIRHPPVVCASDTPVRDLARRMAAAEQSAALVKLPDGEIGIVTDRDLRERVLAAGTPPDAPISAVMTAPAFHVGPDRPGTEVMLEMLDRGIRHVPVVSAFGEPLGVLVAVDLLATHTNTAFTLRREIDGARTQDELEDAAEQMRSAVVALWDAKMPPTQITHIISIVVDALTRRFFEMAVEDLGKPPAAYAWVAVGSLGRREMAPGSDVDSALTWSTGGDPEATEHYGLELGRRVVAGLARCGFAADTHGATAGQPFFVRSVDAWRAALRHAIEEPTKDSGLFMLSLALDSRTVAQVGPASGLPDELRRLDHKRPLRQLMLRLALTHRPPTGFLRGFVVEEGGAHRGQLDIKHGGLLPVTDMARYAALAAGARVHSTPERLRVASIAGVLKTADSRMLNEAFDLFWRLRLAHQVEQLRAGDEPDDFLDPEGLDPLNRRYLRDAFHAIRAMQKRFEAERHFGV